MNANKMADDCESYAEGKYLYPWDRLMEVSTMLRQQETKIRGLEAELAKYKPTSWIESDIGNGEIKYL